jgi:hypothetical protein
MTVLWDHHYIRGPPNVLMWHLTLFRIPGSTLVSRWEDLLLVCHSWMSKHLGKSYSDPKSIYMFCMYSFSELYSGLKKSVLLSLLPIVSKSPSPLRRKIQSQWFSVSQSASIFLQLYELKPPHILIHYLFLLSYHLSVHSTSAWDNLQIPSLTIDCELLFFSFSKIVLIINKERKIPFQQPVYWCLIPWPLYQVSVETGGIFTRTTMHMGLFSCCFQSYVTFFSFPPRHRVDVVFTLKQVFQHRLQEIFLSRLEICPRLVRLFENCRYDPTLSFWCETKVCLLVKFLNRMYKTWFS